MKNSHEVIFTSDGSPTIFLEHLNETYHSRNGALQESKHVLIKMGLEKVEDTKSLVNVLEVGFGTGLNAWLTWNHARKANLKMHYTGIEAFPLPDEVLKEIASGFKGVKETPEMDLLKQIHESPWNENVPLDAHFELLKIGQKVQDVDVSPESVDLVYFDAFGPQAQAEMWEEPVFEHIIPFIEPGGILVSYSAQGQFRRNLKALGMEVEKLEGPPGKREMTRAFKL